MPEQIKIEAIGDNYSTNIYMCRGHVDTQAFVDAILEEYPYEAPIAVDEVEHGFARWIPAKDKDYDTELLYPQMRGRGAFAVTIWEVG